MLSWRVWVCLWWWWGYRVHGADVSWGVADASSPYRWWTEVPYPTASVRVAGCVYPVPWTQPVLRVRAGCPLPLPVCTVGHNLTVTLAPGQATGVLWRMQWDDVVCTARQDHGTVWLTWADEWHAWATPYPLAWARYTLTWRPDELDLRHEQGGVVHRLRLPAPPANASRIRCTWGDTGTSWVHVHRMQWDAWPSVTGGDLLAWVPDASTCVLGQVRQPYQDPEGRWDVPDAPAPTARLYLKWADLVRCAPVGTVVRETDTVTGVMYWDDVPRTFNVSSRE